MSRRKTWRFSPRSERNASQRPSGDHEGAELDLLPNVSWRAAPASTSASQSWVTNAFPTQSVSRTAYATSRPSGDIAGALARSSAIICSSVGSTACAASGASSDARTGRQRSGRRERTRVPPDPGVSGAPCCPRFAGVSSGAPGRPRACSGGMGPPTFVTRCVPLLLATLAPVGALAADGIHWTITGQTSVTFDWRGSESERVIRFGTSPGVYRDSVRAVKPSPVPDSSPGPYWEARLTGLRENTLYHYRIGREPERTFRTPPPRGTSDFWVAEQGDVGSSLSYAGVAPTQALVAADLAAIPGDDRPRFVLVAGDLTYGDDRSPADVDRHFNDVMVWSREAAYLPAWGNQGWDAEPGGDDLNEYEGRFDFPNSRTSPGAEVAVGNGPGEDWYWFDYGNARFIALPEPYQGAREDWFARADTVMTAARADTAIAFIVTFGHRPAWSSGSDQRGHTKLAGMLAALRARHAKYVLDISAHSHHYERSRPEVT